MIYDDTHFISENRLHFLLDSDGNKLSVGDNRGRIGLTSLEKFYQKSDCLITAAP